MVLKSRPKTVEYLGKKQVQQRIEAKNQERNKVDAPEKRHIIGWEHDVRKVGRGQEDEHVVVGVSYVVKVHEALYRILEDKIADHTVSRHEQENAQQDDRWLLDVEPESVGVGAQWSHAGRKNKRPRKWWHERLRERDNRVYKVDYTDWEYDAHCNIGKFVVPSHDFPPPFVPSIEEEVADTEYVDPASEERTHGRELRIWVAGVDAVHEEVCPGYAA